MNARRPISRRDLCASLAASIGAMHLGGCSRQNKAPHVADLSAKPFTGSTFAFDTYCTFTIYGDESAPAKLAQACTRYDGLYNLYDSASDIARINRAGGEPVRVDPDTLDLLERSLSFCESSGGLFDITIGAVSTLWDFTEGKRPSEQEVAEALPHVNWRSIEIDTGNKTVRLCDPQASIDLGGIAKGYVADRLCNLLEQETNATGAALSLGGNIAFFGKKPDGGPWEAGIRDPNDPGGASVAGTVRIAGGSLVTSGLYERTFEADGITYWHILDPRTGFPVATDIVSDTVYCPSSTIADALSTTLFVAGSQQGAAIADAHEATGALFLLQHDKTAESSRWQELTDFSA